MRTSCAARLAVALLAAVRIRSELTGGLCFESLAEELRDWPLAPSSDAGLPAWLSGSLVRVGPALFEVGDEPFVHWFDGQAMLYRFAFANGSFASYTNRFVDTHNLRAHRAAGRVAVTEFGTAPRIGLLRRLWLVLRRERRENPNVNVAQIAGSFVALTDTPPFVQFSLAGLETVGPLNFRDTIGRAQVSSSHLVPTLEGEVLGLATRLGVRLEYMVFSIPAAAPAQRAADDEGAAARPRRAPPALPTRTLLARLPVRTPAYMHSFGVSQRYIVLVEFPWLFSLGGALRDEVRWVLTGRPRRGLEAIFRWEPARGATFTVLERRSGSLVGRWRAPAFFSYHHVNAYEDDASGALHVDMACYDRPFYDVFRLEALRTSAFAKTWSHRGQLRRYSLPLGELPGRTGAGGAEGGDPSHAASPPPPRGAGRSPPPLRLSAPRELPAHAVLADRMVEFPRFDPRRQGRPYRYVYGFGYPRAEGVVARAQPAAVEAVLIKVDIHTGAETEWARAYCAPSEPTFVPRPDGTDEDDGVVLSVVYDNRAGASFLLVLNATTFEERTQLVLPHAIPAMLHGDFFADAGAALVAGHEQRRAAAADGASDSAGAGLGPRAV